MKKISLLGLCLFTGLSMMAQTNVLKDVERQLKGGSPNYQDALNKIKPALQNDETKGLAQTWYLAGKAGFGVYDQAYIQESLGQSLDAKGKRNAGQSLIDGYNYYLTAIPLDKKPDEKGKVKPKYTKDIIKAASSNYQQLKNAGIFLFEGQDYKGAYDAWELYVTLPNNELLGDGAPKAEPDSVVGNIMYYQTLAALEANENDKALKKANQAMEKGFNNIDIYRYGVEAARRLNDSIALVDMATKGYEKFGTEDISFVGQLINDRLAAEDYAASHKLVSDAIAGTNNDSTKIKSQLYDILGFIYEQEGNVDLAMQNFNKAIELDPDFAKPVFDLGRIIYNEAVKLDENYTDEAVRTEKVTPKLLEAAKYFEKAYGMDPDNMTQIPNIMYRLYYRLGEGYEDKATEWQNK